MIGGLLDSPWKILIVAVVLIVLFGSAKLPVAARSLGKSMRILKSEVSSLHKNDTEPGPAVSAPARQAGRRHRAARARRLRLSAAVQDGTGAGSGRLGVYGLDRG